MSQVWNSASARTFHYRISVKNYPSSCDSCIHNINSCVSVDWSFLPQMWEMRHELNKRSTRVVATYKKEPSCFRRKTDHLRKRAPSWGLPESSTPLAFTFGLELDNFDLFEARNVLRQDVADPGRGDFFNCRWKRGRRWWHCRCRRWGGRHKEVLKLWWAYCSAKISLKDVTQIHSSHWQLRNFWKASLGL